MPQTTKEETLFMEGTEAVPTYTFKKEDGKWYSYQPEYGQQGCNRKDFELPEGAHKLLNRTAHGTNKVTLRLSTEPFAGADLLELVEHCEAPKGGAIYLLHTCHGTVVDSLIWICDLALYVFGDLPEQIYFQRVQTRQHTGLSRTAAFSIQ